MRSIPLNKTKEILKSYAGKCAVYMLTWGGLSYIGSSANLKKRITQWRSNLRLEKDCKFRILVACEPADQFTYEAACIRIYKTHTKGRNRDLNGRGFGCAPTEQARARMRLAAVNKPKSETHRINIAKAKQGTNNPMFNVKHTEEARLKIKEASLRMWAIRKGLKNADPKSNTY